MASRIVRTFSQFSYLSLASVVEIQGVNPGDFWAHIQKAKRGAGGRANHQRRKESPLYAKRFGSAFLLHAACYS
jgi:hypothetical protein